MNPAKYRYRVEVQELTSVRNNDGEWEDKWSTVRKIWLARQDKGGDEYFIAKANNAVRTTIWLSRFDKEMYKNGESKRLFYNDVYHDIKSVADKTGRRIELEIITEAVVS